MSKLADETLSKELRIKRKNMTTEDRSRVGEYGEPAENTDGTLETQNANLSMARWFYLDTERKEIMAHKIPWHTSRPRPLS